MTGIASRRRAILFLLIGFLVAFAFGSLWGVFFVRERLERQTALALGAHGSSVFATIDSSRQISRWGRTYYFYTYSGYLHNRVFRKEEQVGADIFFRLSEGKNVPVRAYLDFSGQIVTRIPQNSVPFETDLRLIRTLCFYLTLVGVLIMIPGMPALFGRRKK